MEHTRVEKDLKRDIVTKNTLLKKIRGMNRKVLKWQRRAERLTSRRKCKKPKQYGREDKLNKNHWAAC